MLWNNVIVRVKNNYKRLSVVRTPAHFMPAAVRSQITGSRVASGSTTLRDMPQVGDNVGMGRFELPASASRTQRATGLRYIPISAEKIVRVRIISIIFFDRIALFFRKTGLFCA